MIDAALSFLTESTPPQENYVLNDWESAGDAFLFPASTILTHAQVKTPSEELHLHPFRLVQAVALGVFTLPLTLIGAAVRGIGQAIPHPVMQATDEHVEQTNHLQIQQCYDLAATFNQVCLDNGFVSDSGMPLFYMCSGTALGAVRHGGIIPWDDDCDFVVFKENEERLRQLFDRLQEAGIEITNLRFDSTYKMQFSAAMIQEKYKETPSPQTTGAIDIFIWNKMSDGSYTYDKLISRNRWPKEYFSAKDIENGFELFRFGPQKTSLPLLKKPDDYLKRYYGPNFKTHGIKTHGHLNVSVGDRHIQIPFFKLKAHYFEIRKWKGCYAEGLSSS
ncbi:MAG TPA: hypothetical protein DCE71_07425 [Parachlamydiales bacterium]|nr:hypothetical protein [Parachlamydiales bacterium]